MCPSKTIHLPSLALQRKNTNISLFTGGAQVQFGHFKQEWQQKQNPLVLLLPILVSNIWSCPLLIVYDVFIYFCPIWRQIGGLPPPPPRKVKRWPAACGASVHSPFASCEQVLQVLTFFHTLAKSVWPKALVEQRNVWCNCWQRSLSTPIKWWPVLF